MSVVKDVNVNGAPTWTRVPQRALQERAWTRGAWQEQLRRGEPLRDIVVIDAHAHLGEYGRFFINKPDAASLVTVMDRIGIQTAIVTANPSLRAEPEIGNQLVLEATRQFPGRLLGYVTANPHYVDDLERTLNHYLDQPGMVGIKLHPECHDDYPLLGPRYEPVWAVAGQRHVPVLFHTYFGGDGPEDIAALAARHPTVPLLVGHALQDKSFETMAELANAFPNVYVDLSVPEIFGLTEFFVEALDDIRKLIFGSDFPWGNCHFRVGAVVYSRIPEETKRRILGQNIAELLAVSPSAHVEKSREAKHAP